jgi:hypothetical protein
MRNLLRVGLAGYGANRLGGRMGCGCFGTVILFLILYFLLGSVL